MVRWGAFAILTDVPWTYIALRRKLEGQSFGEKLMPGLTNITTANFEEASRISRLFLWTTLRYYTARQILYWRLERWYLESIRGPFQKVPVVTTA